MIIDVSLSKARAITIDGKRWVNRIMFLSSFVMGRCRENVAEVVERERTCSVCDVTSPLGVFTNGDFEVCKHERWGSPSIMYVRLTGQEVENGGLGSFY